MDIYSISRAKDFNRCRRLHYFAHVLGRRSRRVADTLTFGSLLHAGLEQWWEYHRDPIADSYPERGLDLAHAGIRAAVAATADGAVDALMLIRLEELITGYHHRWWAFARGCKVLGTERAFSTPLINPNSGHASRRFRFGGRIDGIIEVPGPGGGIWILEHKTSTDELEPGSAYWQKLRIDGQVSAYYEGARALGYHDIRACLYDVARRPMLKPHNATPMEKRQYRKDGALYASQRAENESLGAYRERLRNEIAEAPGEYYQHGTVVRLDSELHEYRQDAWETAHEMATAIKSNRHPRNPDACFKYERACEYFEVCTHIADLDDDTRFTTRRHDPAERGPVQEPLPF